MNNINQGWLPGWICTKHGKAHDKDCGYLNFQPPEALPSHNGLEEEAATLPAVNPISDNTHKQTFFPPTPPNEVDELKHILGYCVDIPHKTCFYNEKGDEFVLTDPKHAQTRFRAAQLEAIQAFITKQNQAYHAAGLRELRKELPPPSSVNGELGEKEEAGYNMAVADFKKDLRAAIAKEESK